MTRSLLMLVVALTIASMGPLIVEAAPYGATYTPAAIPPLTVGQTTTVSVPVSNTGTLTWSSTGPTPFYLAYHWYATGAVPAGTVPSTPPPNYGAVVFNGLRTKFPGPVPPGGTVTLAAQVQAPSKPGTYVLKWDLVRENVAWFSWQGVLTKDQTVTVRSVARAAAPTGTIALMCKLFDCTPKIKGVVPLFSRIEPGGPVLVTGENLGNRPGKLRLVGIGPQGPLGGFPGGVLELEVNDWGDTFAYGTIPEVTGVFDQPVSVQAVTWGGLMANAPSRSWFTARQDYRALPGLGIARFSCAPGKYVNDYAYCVGYNDLTGFYGYHRTDHKILNPGDNGTDVLETRTLKNWWVFDYMDLTETQKDDGRVDWVDGFKSGSKQVTVNVRWSTGRQGSIYYLIRLHIKGPAGLPFVD
jgi:hypothetical protein